MIETGIFRLPFFFCSNPAFMQQHAARADVECLSRELAMTHVCSRAHGCRLDICLLHLLPPKHSVIVFLSFAIILSWALWALDTSSEGEERAASCLGCFLRFGLSFTPLTLIKHESEQTFWCIRVVSTHNTHEM